MTKGNCGESVDKLGERERKNFKRKEKLLLPEITIRERASGPASEFLSLDTPWLAGRRETHDGSFLTSERTAPTLRAGTGEVEGERKRDREEEKRAKEREIPSRTALLPLPFLSPSSAVAPLSLSLSLSLSLTSSLSRALSSRNGKSERHRQEKNRLSWAKEKLDELLPGVEGELSPSTSTSGRGSKTKAVVRISSVCSVEGDAYQSTRKGGKKISAYDLKLELRWEVVEAGDGGEEEGSGDKGKEVIAGDLKVLELTTGHDDDDLLFEASTGHKAFEAREVAEALKGPLIKALAVFVAELVALEL